jgi:hypothetical protein
VTEVLKEVQYFTLGAAGTPTASATVKLPLQACVQYDAFINKVGTTFESGVVVQFTTQNLSSDYHTSSGLNTLVSFAQTTDSDKGTCPPPPPLDNGSTATIGFWQNPNGQAIINGLGTTATGETAGQWLAQTFPNLFGGASGSQSTASMTNAELATYYKQVFSAKGGPKTLAQAFDLALATYATDVSLNTSATDQALAQSFGFQVSIGGTGGKTFALDTSTANALGLSTANGNNFSVLQILLALDQYAGKNGLSSITTFNDLLDNINSTFDIP